MSGPYRDGFWRRVDDLVPPAPGAELLACWHSLRPAPDRLPSRSAFDPMALHRLIRNLVLVNVERPGGSLHFTYRLIGTGVTDLASRDATGRALDESLYGPNTERMLTPYRLVANSGRPALTRSPVLFADRWFVVENTFVPFAADGFTVDIIACLVHRIVRDPADMVDHGEFGLLREPDVV